MGSVSSHRARLGRGECTTSEAACWEARRIFLAAASQVAPSTYWSLFPDRMDDATRRALGKRWKGDPEGMAASENAWYERSTQEYQARWNDDPEATIAAWQARWNLRDAWLADVARQTLRARFRYHARGRTLLIGVNGPPPGLFVTPTCRNVHAGRLLGLPLDDLYWNPSDETRADARSRLIRAVDAELDRVEADVAGSPAPRKSPEHFDWLARYQVLGVSGLSIARTLPTRNPDTIPEQAARRVQKAIVVTARLIGLSLRHDPYRGLTHTANIGA